MHELQIDHDLRLNQVSMAIQTLLRRSANVLLRRVNARIESLTADRIEGQRLQRLVDVGEFDRDIFPVPNSFTSMDCSPLLREIAAHRERFAEFAAQPASSDYSFHNDYFSSPDAEVLYAAIHLYRPSTILEIGSGNSSRLSRVAIQDGKLPTRLISVDPEPRTDIANYSDVVIRQSVETLDCWELSRQLRPNDLLFIDSSHVLTTGSDVSFMYLRLIPLLPTGVLIHVHDVFLPYEYPQEWIVQHRWGWNEQYLVQAMLAFGDQFDVLWAGYYLQRTRSDFALLFPNLGARRASSLWLRKRGHQPRSVPQAFGENQLSSKR